MKVYRCCGVDEVKAYKEGYLYKKMYGKGTNTFNYEKNIDYIHFFYFAECMYHYKYNKNGYSTNYFVEYDIPLEILKNYFGYGFYEKIIPGYYTPVPEFALPYDQFKTEYVKNIFYAVDDRYMRKEVWQLYKDNLSKKYLADFVSGTFMLGYNKYSILDITLDKVLCLSKKS